MYFNLQLHMIWLEQTTVTSWTPRNQINRPTMHHFFTHHFLASDLRTHPTARSVICLLFHHGSSTKGYQKAVSYTNIHKCVRQACQCICRHTIQTLQYQHVRQEETRWGVATQGERKPVTNCKLKSRPWYNVHSIRRQWSGCSSRRELYPQRKACCNPR